MKKKVYFNYTACISVEVEYTTEEELEKKVDRIQNEVTDQEILKNIQLNLVDY